MNRSSASTTKWPLFVVMYLSPVSKCSPEKQSISRGRGSRSSMTHRSCAWRYVTITFDTATLTMLKITLQIALHLQDMVVDGDKTKAIDVTEEVTAKRAGYPAIELVRRETSGEGVASTSGTIVRRKQDGEMRTLNTGTETDLRRQDEESNETVNKDKDGKPDENDFPNDDEVLLDHVEQQEKLNEEPVQSAACPQAHDKDEANERKVDHDIAEQKTEKTIQVANKGQVQDGDKIGVEVFEPSFDTTNRDDEDHDDEVPDPEQSEPKDKPAKQTLNVDKAFSEINDKSSKEIRDEIDVMSELPVDKLPKGGEPIISGNIGGANAEVIFNEFKRNHKTD